MATGVNVKMGVSGVAQFKQNINAAKQSIKTMDQALSLNEKQFRATGDAEDYMQQKGELLQAKMREQRTVIEQTERALKQMADGGVDKGSKAFQEMQRQLLAAKGDLLDTESALSGIDQAGEDAANSVDGMNTQLKNIGKNVSLETIKSGIDGITGKMQAAARWAWKLGEALVKNVLGAGSYADDLKTTADKYGETILEFGGGDSAVETLQRMQKTARLIDTDVDTIIGAHDKLKRAMGKEKDQETMGAFAALGIDPNDHENVEDAFWKAGEALMNWGDEVEKEEYAQKLFGKSWKELLPLFKAGRGEYEETMQSWSVLSQEQIDNLGKMDDSYQTMSAEWETFKQSILETLSGPMQEIMDTITRLLQELNQYLSSEEGQKMMEELGDAIKEFFSGLKDVDFKDVVEKVKGALEGIKGAFDWIVENKDAIVTAIGALALAFGGLKLAGLAVSLGQLVSGFKGLFGKGGEPTGGSPVATTGAATGGAMVGIKNAVTAGSVKAANLIGGTGMLFPVLGDMFMNQTNAGRSLRDGGNFWEGIQQDIAETAESLKHNAETFADNWDPNSPNANVIAKLFGHRDENADAAERLATGANWAPSYMGGMQTPQQVNRLPDALNQMPSYMRGQRPAGNEPTHQDFQEFSGLPQQILAAVKQGVANITVVVDGPTMAGTVGGAMANTMLMMTK